MKIKNLVNQSLFTVIRDGKTKEVKVKLKQQKEQPKRQSRSERQSPGQGDRDFFR